MGIVFIWGERKDPERLARQGLSTGMFLIQNAAFYTWVSVRKTHSSLSQCHPIFASKTVIPHRRDYNNLWAVRQTSMVRGGKQPGDNFPKEKRQTQSMTTRKANDYYEAVAAILLTMTASSSLCLDLNQTNRDGEKTSSTPKGKEPQAPQNLLKFWLFPIFLSCRYSSFIALVGSGAKLQSR